ACPQGDQACIQGCLAAATPAAQDQAIELSQCAQAADANGEDVEAACGDLIAACFGEPPPPGDLTCSEIFECAAACPANDQNCIQGCLQAGTAEAQDQAITTSQCAQTADMNGQDPEVACAAEFEACFGPPAPPGDQACGQVLSCSAEAQDAAAAEACYNAGTEAARDLFEAVALCLNENMCMDLECPACEAPIAACNADGQ
ncbi:MAG: hypothetical protein KC549_16570, partial [Myxococcales bacterium]|nr:hypothetical protein [Myxococcales bacterium]